MVAKKPEDRPQTMTQVMAELERCLSGGSPTIAIQPNSNTTTSGLSVGSGNELQDFLRQISGGENSTAKSAAPSGSKRTAVTPSSVEAETMISSAGEGGTDPRTEQSLTIERSRGQKKKAAILVSVAAAVVVLLGIMFVVRGKSGTLHLAITEELIEVTIGDTGRVVKGVKEEEVRLPIGEHVLHVKRNDLAFDTDAFEVTQAEPVSIKVERVGRRVRVMQGKTLLGHKESSKSDAVVGSPPPAAKAPFGAQQARAHQEAWAKHLGVPVEYENTIGMKFVLIPPGEFLMGSTPAEIEAALKIAGGEKQWQECIKSEAPQHKVILTQPIYLGVHEVTQAEYEQVMKKNPSHFAPLGAGKETVSGLDTTSHPVEMVSWNDAAEFCAKLSKQEKLQPFYCRTGEAVTSLDGTGYRLPTEADWEFACRAGTTTKSLDRRQRRRLGAGRLVRRERRRPDACGARIEGESVRAVRHARQCLGVGSGLVGTDLLRPIPE
ncbi:MAG: formylglycine-generating enzyme family protein [Planctomycetia bacterium]|nr:formylglycine-generating enzyme family protein [Planctomycetia bacterium]